MKFIPHSYQKYNINRIIQNPAIALWLDMGLGKTAITLTAVNDLKYNRFEVNKILVVAPKKVAQGTWTNEARKWDHLQLLRFSIVLGSQQKRIRALNKPADIYIINRDNVVWLVDYYRNQWPFDMVILDESSSFKNHQSKRFKALKQVRPHIKRIVELTGTPAPNGLIDTWAQIYLLDQGERLGKRITGFRERYFEPDQRNRDRVFSYAPKDGAENKIHSLLNDIVVSMKAEDYIELPPVTYNSIPVILDEKAKKSYEKLEKEMLLEVDEAEITATSAAVLGGKLLQLCNGAVYDENRSIIDIHKNKLEAFLELIEALNGSPVLVFYSFQHDKDRIKKALEKTNLKVRELKTAQDEDDWNNKEIDVLLAHPASAGYGLNLQKGGNHVVWYGLNWSLELYEQANARLVRQGQKEKVFIHRLIVQGGMDENVEDALKGKAVTQNNLLAALKARIEKVKEEA
ncbi:DEAD/DEAH box helicase [Sediminibacillus massiliensis]|uniref:DEAD/DEAH box helicase n=1 Tax=Sediminibacillus massiliensis TaxID=1926277 RepID=UPI0009888ADA|nr:DEAD/DEAH box helicase [Sediminibacillus massiliensis]